MILSLNGQVCTPAGNGTGYLKVPLTALVDMLIVVYICHHVGNFSR